MTPFLCMVWWCIQVTGEPLTKRSDDNEEALMKRLQSYHTQTCPLLDYYRDQNLLVQVDASKSPDEVWSQVLEAVEKCSNK